MSLDIGPKRRSRWGQNARKFLKTGNSKRGLVGFLGNSCALKAVMAAPTIMLYRCQNEAISAGNSAVFSFGGSSDTCREAFRSNVRDY